MCGYGSYGGYGGYNACGAVACGLNVRFGTGYGWRGCGRGFGGWNGCASYGGYAGCGACGNEFFF